MNKTSYAFEKDKLRSGLFYNQQICNIFMETSGSTEKKRKNQSDCLKTHQTTRLYGILLLIFIGIGSICMGIGIYYFSSPIYQYLNSWKTWFLIGFIVLSLGIAIYLFKNVSITSERYRLSNELI